MAFSNLKLVLFIHYHLIQRRILLHSPMEWVATVVEHGCMAVGVVRRFSMKRRFRYESLRTRVSQPVYGWHEDKTSTPMRSPAGQSMTGVG